MHATTHPTSFSKRFSLLLMLAFSLQFSVLAQSTCSLQGVALAYDVTSNSATVYVHQIVANPNISHFQIEYGETGFAIGSGIIQGVPNDTVQLQGLQPDKEYTVHWRAFCQGGLLSSSQLSMSFRTACTAVFPLPHTAHFDTYPSNEVGVLDNCWHLQPEDGAILFAANQPYWATHTGFNNLLTGPASDPDGVGSFIYLNTTQGVVGDEAMAYSPVLDFTNQFEVDLTFYYHMFGAHMGTLTLDVHDGIGWVNGVWSIGGEKHTSAAEPWTKVQIDLSDFDNKPHVQLRFRGEKGGPESYMALDDLNIQSNGDGLADFGRMNAEQAYPDKALVEVHIPHDGRSTITQRGVAYALHPNPTIADDTVLAGVDTGSFSVVLHNMPSIVPVFIRAFAINGNGISYSEEVIFNLFPYAEVDTTFFNWQVNEHRGITAICSDNNGSLYVNGNYLYNPSLDPSFLGLFRVDANGSIDQSWKPQLDGTISNTQELPPLLKHMEIYNGHLYVAGEIDTIDNQARHGIARFDVATGQLNSWAPNLNFPYSVDHFVFNQNKLYAVVLDTVDWSSNNPALYASKRVVEIDLTTGAVSNWNPQIEDHQGKGPSKLAIFQDHLIVLGEFNDVGGNFRTHLAAFDLNNGLQLSPWYPVLTNVPHAMLVVGGQLVVAGSFNYISGVEASGLATFDGLSNLPSRTSTTLEFGPDYNALWSLTEHKGILFAGVSGFQMSSRVVRFPFSDLNKIEEVSEVRDFDWHAILGRLLSLGDEIIVAHRSERLPGIGMGGVLTKLRPTTVFINTDPVPKPRPDVALLKGEVLSEGGLGVSASGFVWGTGFNPDFNDFHRVVSAGKGSLELELDAVAENLAYGVTYYTRSFAISANDTVFGISQPFSFAIDSCRVPYAMPFLERFDGNTMSCWSPDTAIAIEDPNLVNDQEMELVANNYFRYVNDNVNSPAQLPELISPYISIDQPAILRFRWSTAMAHPQSRSNLLLSYQVEGSNQWDTLAYYQQMDNGSAIPFNPPILDRFLPVELPIDTALVGANLRFRFTFDITESDFYLDAFSLSPIPANCASQTIPVAYDFNEIIPGRSNDTLDNCVFINQAMLTRDGLSGHEGNATVLVLAQDQLPQTAVVALPRLTTAMSDELYLHFDYLSTGQDIDQLRVALQAANGNSDTAYWVAFGAQQAQATDPMQRVSLSLENFLQFAGSTPWIDISLIAQTNGIDAQIFLDNIQVVDSSLFAPNLQLSLLGSSSSEALFNIDIRNPHNIALGTKGLCISNAPGADTSATLFPLYAPYYSGLEARAELLNPFQMYYARAFVQSDSGLVYSNEVSFFTTDTLLASEEIISEFFGTPKVMVSDGAQGWYVGGRNLLQTAPGVMSHLVHINANAQVTGLVNDLQNPGSSATIEDLHLVNGKLYIAGEFTSIEGHNAQHLARWDVASGQLDAWYPNIPQSAFVERIEANNSRVFALFADNSTIEKPLTIAEIDPVNANVPAWRATFTQTRANQPEEMAIFQNHLVVVGGHWALPGQSQYGLSVFDLSNNNQAVNWYPYSHAINQNVVLYDVEVVEDSLLIVAGFISTDTSAAAMGTGLTLAVFDQIGGQAIASRSQSFGEYARVVKALGDELIVKFEMDMPGFPSHDYQRLSLADLNSSRSLPELNVATSDFSPQHLAVGNCQLASITPIAWNNPNPFEASTTSLRVMSPRKVLFDPIFSWNMPTDSSLHASTNLLSNGGFGVESFGLCLSTQALPEITDTVWEATSELIMEHTFTKLAPNTDYYVRPYLVNCDGVTYGPQQLMRTAPDCSPKPLPYEVNFESDDELLCWGMSDAALIERKTDCAGPGTSAMMLQGVPSLRFQSPLIDLVGQSGLEVSYKYWNPAAACGDATEAGDVLAFGWVDTNNFFHVLKTYDGGQAPQVPTQDVFNIPVNYVGDLYFQFEVFSGDGNMTDQWMVDDFLVKGTDLCHLAGSTGLQEFNGTAATVYIRPLVTPTEYLIEYGLQGFTPGTGQSITSTKDTVVVPNLQPNQTYELHWRALCDNGDTSDVLVQFINTPCAVLSLPYAESFDMGEPACWVLDDKAQAVAVSDGDYLLGNYWNWSNGTEATARTPRIHLNSAAKVSFQWAHQFHPTWPDDSLKLQLRSRSTGTWQTLISLGGATFDSPNAQANQPAPDSSFVREEMNLPAALVGDTVEFRFWLRSGYGPNVYVDDFSVEASASACNTSYNSTAEVLSNYTVRFRWNSTGALNYGIRLRTLGENQWQTFLSADTSRILQNRAPGDYEYYIVDLDNGDSSCVDQFTVNCATDITYTFNAFQAPELGRLGRVRVFGTQGGKRLYDIHLVDENGDSSSVYDVRQRNYTDLEAGAYQLYVRDDFGCLADSVGSFVIEAMDTAFIPNLINAPNNPPNGFRPTWNSVNGVINYQLRVVNVTDGTLQLFQTGINDTMFAVTNLPTGKLYRFNVRSRYNNGAANVVSGYSNAVSRNLPIGGNKGELLGDEEASAGTNINLSIYPNPTNGLLYVLAPEGSTLTLIDMNGRTIAQQKVNAPEEVVDLSELAQGVYLLEVNSGGQLFRERVVKQ